MSPRKRTAWNDRRKLGNSSNRLKDWKDDGDIVVAIQTSSGITPRLFHLVPYVGKDDETGKKIIRYLPFVCHEDPIAYANRVPPEACPIDRLIELLTNDDSIGDDDVVWDASIGKAQKDRIVTKADFCNFKDADWKGSFKPRQQYVLAVVEVEHPENGLCVTVESVTMGDAIIDCVNNEIDGNGEDIGDPSVNPYAFKFSYDKSAQPKDKYSAFAYRRAEMTDEIRKLIESDPVDISNWIAHGNSADLRKLFEEHLKIDVDLDMLFDSVLDPDSDETKNKKGAGDDSSDADEGDDNETAEPAAEPDTEDCDTCDGKGTIGKKNSKCPDCEGSGKVIVEYVVAEETPVGETPVDEEKVVCELCDGNGTVGKKEASCPDCDGEGLVDAEGESAPDPEPEPEPPKKTTGKKGGKKGGKKKKDEEPPPDPNSNTKCGGCQRLIPDDANICPFCGAEFGDDED